MTEPTTTVPEWHRRKPQNGIEYRCVDVRANEAHDGFSGYAATFGVVDSYWTAFAKGAFRKSVKDRGAKLPVLWQHNPDWPIGRHIEIKEDKTGLYVDTHIVDDGAEGSVALKRLRADVPLGLSFGFQTLKDRSAEDADELDFSQNKTDRANVRVITEVKMWETSVVTFPANESAQITAVRSDMDADTLSTITEAIRAGRIDERSAALIAELVLAWGERAEPVETPLTPDPARRNRDIAIAVAQLNAQYGHLIGVSA